MGVLNSIKSFFSVGYPWWFVKGMKTPPPVVFKARAGEALKRGDAVVLDEASEITPETWKELSKRFGVKFDANPPNQNDMSSKIIFPSDDMVEIKAMEAIMTDIVRALVDDPFLVNVVMTRTCSAEIYDIHVGPLDVGYVLGKKGATVAALRTLTNSIAGRGRVKTIVNVVNG